MEESRHRKGEPKNEVVWVKLDSFPIATRFMGATILDSLHTNSRRNFVLKHLEEAFELLIRTYLDMISHEVA